MRYLTRAEVETALYLGEQVHKGKRPLPPEIVLKKVEIEKETRNAELFMARVGAIDEGMINHVVQLKLELDALYGAWVASETAAA